MNPSISLVVAMNAVAATASAAPAFFSGFGNAGTLGASLMAPSQFPMNLVAASTTVPLASPVLASSFPMGGVLLPPPVPMSPLMYGGRPPIVPAADAAPYPPAAPYAGWVKEAFVNAPAAEFQPNQKWNDYKESFDVHEGMPEDGLAVASREMISLDKWFGAFVNSPMVNSYQGIMGTNPPQYNTFGSYGEPSVPIMPCPPGTPPVVCKQAAEDLARQNPMPQNYDGNINSHYMGMQYSNMLTQQGYPGFGAVSPQMQLKQQPNLHMGPAPVTTLKPQHLNCEAEVELSTKFNSPQASLTRLERSLSFSASYGLVCACTDQGSPRFDQCRKQLGGGAAKRAHSNTTLPPASLPYPLQWFNMAFLDGTAHTPAEYQPCGAFDAFDPKAPCRTVVVAGVTEPPLFRPAGGKQIAQPMFDDSSFQRKDPFSCYVGVTISWNFDSPFAWENEYNTQYEYESDSLLECLCDQYHNAIFNSCRQGVTNKYPIPQVDTIEPLGNWGDAASQEAWFGSKTNPNAPTRRQASPPAQSTKSKSLQLQRAVQDAERAAATVAALLNEIKAGGL